MGGWREFRAQNGGRNVDDSFQLVESNSLGSCFEVTTLKQVRSVEAAIRLL